MLPRFKDIFGLPGALTALFLAGMFVMNPQGCDGDEPEPEDDEGSAVLCDFLCVTADDGKNECEWTCEDPEMEVTCNFCEYRIESGKATFQCTHCDVGTY